MNAESMNAESMNAADRIAVRVKHAIHEFEKAGMKPRKIFLGAIEMHHLSTNQSQCDPPDFVTGEMNDTFCGVPVFEAFSLAEGVAYEFYNL